MVCNTIPQGPIKHPRWSTDPPSPAHSAVALDALAIGRRHVARVLVTHPRLRRILRHRGVEGGGVGILLSRGPCWIIR